MQEADRGSTWEGDEREERERRRATAAAKKCRGWVESLVEPAAGGSARRQRERERGGRLIGREIWGKRFDN